MKESRGFGKNIREEGERRYWLRLRAEIVDEEERGSLEETVDKGERERRYWLRSEREDSC